MPFYRNRFPPSSPNALCASALALRAPYDAQSVVNAQRYLPYTSRNKIRPLSGSIQERRRLVSDLDRRSQAAIAKKKGLRGGVYFLAIIVLGPVVAMGTSVVTQGNGVVAATLALLVPIVALVVVLLAKSGQQIAAETGQFGEYKKCSFCAEPVRLEAVKCKHCGSTLEPGVPGDTSGAAH